MTLAAVQQDQIRQPSKAFAAVLFLHVVRQAAGEYLAHARIVVLSLDFADLELFIRFFERTAVFKHHHAADLRALAKV